MKVLLLSILANVFIVIPVMAQDQNSSAATKPITLYSGLFHETYKPIASHGLTFRCLALEEGDFKWGISTLYAGVPALKNEIKKSMSDNVTLSIKENANFCKNFAWMQAQNLQDERETLNILAGDLYIRLLGVTQGMSAEEMSNSKDTNIVACVTDLVNVEYLNEISSECKQ